MVATRHLSVEAASSDARLVADACQKAALELGLSKDELGEIVGRHRTSLERRWLEPSSKEGQLGLLFLRVARSLDALMGSARGSSSSRWKVWGGLRPTWMLSMVEAQHIQPLGGVVFRITDHQGYQATERWTRNLAEQARLEALINIVKPPLPAHALRLLQGSALPQGRSIHRQQTSFSVQVQTPRGVRLQECLDD